MSFYGNYVAGAQLYRLEAICQGNDRRTRTLADVRPETLKGIYPTANNLGLLNKQVIDFIFLTSCL